VIEALTPLVSTASSALPDRAAFAAPQAGATGFGEMLTQFATTAVGHIEQAEQASLAKMSGADISLREVVDKVMAAQQSLHTALAIRDKIVQAYIEISHTQI